MEREGPLTPKLSTTQLADEYALITDGISRCSANVAALNPSPYDPKVVAAVRNMWLQRMEVEHRSTSVFSQLAHQLMEANATLDAKVVMLRMAQDELRHTETCGDVVVALGGEPVKMAKLDVVPLATHRGCSAEERALRNVIFATSLSEMVAIARLVDNLETITDPFLRDRSRLLLADEILHGQYGFHYLQMWRPWLEAHPDVIASLHRYLRHGFAFLERELAGPPSGGKKLTDDERALGIFDPVRNRDIFYTTVEEALAPGLDAFGLEATKAWRTRRTEDVGTQVAPLTF